MPSPLLSSLSENSEVERRDEPRFDSGPPPPYLAARRNHSVMDVTMNHLDALEAQSVYILREAFNKFDRLGMLWSLGKDRSEEHTSELQSLMRISYAVFCLKKKKTEKQTT